MNFMDKLAMVKIVTEYDKVEMTKQAASGEEVNSIRKLIDMVYHKLPGVENFVGRVSESTAPMINSGVNYAKEHPLQTIGGIGAGGAGMYGAKKVYDNYL